MASVVLLRSPSQDTPDPYEEAFTAAGYHPSSVPALETTLTNLDDLARVLQELPSMKAYTGVVMTSARACEAWKAVVTTILARGASLNGFRHTQHASSVLLAKWSSLPFYVVGKATAKALGAVRDIYGDTHLTPVDICGASESGTSERLGHFILDDLRKRDAMNPKLLYLTGDKNRDTLPNILRDGGVQMDFMQVYETQPSSRLAVDLEAVINAANPTTNDWWIVFFAPSAAKAVLPTFREWFHLGFHSAACDPERSRSLKRAKLAAIGPTTATSLHDELNLSVDVMAMKPTPSDLVKAVNNYDRVKIPGPSFLA